MFIVYIPVAAAYVNVAPKADAKGEILWEWLKAVHERLIALKGHNPCAAPPGIWVVFGKIAGLYNVHFTFEIVAEAQPVHEAG